MKFKENQELLLNMYSHLLAARRYEEKLIKWFGAGDIPGWIHSGLGQEATGVAICQCLTKDDFLVPYFRSRSSLIAKGMDLRSLTAEIFGRETGCCRGRAGEAHLADPSLNILGAGGLIGSPIPMGTGMAYAARLEDQHRIVACVFGDGATSQGAFHESLNIAAVMDLPIVFVCENNQFAEFSTIPVQMKIGDVSQRAVSYGMPGCTVDGNDPIAVYEAMKEASGRAREGGGPTLLETKTYRIRGHYEGDPARYRTEEEVEKWKKKDPLILYRNRLLAEGVLDDRMIEEFEKQVQMNIAEAYQFATDSPFPSRKSLMESVYE